MEEDLISIIVPVYNSAQYISDCAGSVQAQTYSHFELIFIDDGSSDGSRELCREMCKTDSRIRVIEKTHKGVSAARNAGIREAKGKYLFFLDSDDAIHPRLIETLYMLLEESGAVIATERRYRAEERMPGSPDGEGVHAAEDPDDFIYLESERAVDCRVFASSDTALFGIGGKMILREITENIEFDERLTHGEDTLFMYRLLAAGADVVVLCHAWYYYRKRGDGAAAVFSAEACRSRYAAERWICDQEIKYKRIWNAVYWENAILSALMQWYEAGRQNSDPELMAYTRERADAERKRRIFSKVGRIRRFEFFCMFYCYPLYRFFPFILKLRQWRMKIWSKRWIFRWICGQMKWKVIWCGQVLWMLLWKMIWISVDLCKRLLKKEEADERKG